MTAPRGEPDHGARAALAALLRDLFSARQLRRWVRRWPAVAAELPGDVASDAHLASDLVDELERRGLVTRALFDLLLAARPGRAEDIERVAALWGLGDSGSGESEGGDSGDSGGSGSGAGGSGRGGEAAPVSRHQVVGVWVFGGALLIFLGYIFWFAPAELPPFKHQLLGFFTALTAGLLASFITGALMLQIEHEVTRPGSRRVLAVQGTLGAAMFVLVLLWWGSPLAPVAPGPGPGPGPRLPDAGPVVPRADAGPPTLPPDAGPIRDAMQAPKDARRRIRRRDAGRGPDATPVPPPDARPTGRCRPDTIEAMNGNVPDSLCGEPPEDVQPGANGKLNWAVPGQPGVNDRCECVPW